VEVTTHRARIVWEGGKEDLRAHRVELGEQVLSASSMAANGGDGSKADPEDMLVAALSSCHMLWFLDFARREKLRVASYEDEAKGTLSGDRFTDVVLRPRVEWQGEAPDARTAASLHHKAHEACYIANSVNFPVEVELS
jgi:organic hydroperoxide reductase OsmC/OhrA